MSRASASSAKTSAGASPSRRARSRRAARSLAVAIERGEERVPEHLLLAAAGGSVERRRRLERGPGLGAPPERAQDPAEMDAAERGEPDVPGGLGFGDPELQRRRAGLVVPGLALCASEARELVGLGLQEAESSVMSRRPGRGA